MKKNKELAQQEPVRVLSKEHITAFEAIAANKTRIKLDQEALADDVKALGEKLGWKSGKLNAVISMYMREQEKGGVIQDSNDVIEVVEQILGVTTDPANTLEH